MDDNTPTPIKQGDPTQDDFPVKGIPAIDRYMKVYGRSCGGDDRKGAKLFKEYEGREQLQRFIRELHAIRTNKTSEELCERVIGKARKSKFETYARWAVMVIGALNTRD